MILHFMKLASLEQSAVLTPLTKKGGDRKSFKRDSRLTAVREGRGETQSGPNYLLAYILYLLLTDFSTVWSFTRFPQFLHLWHIHLETVIFRTMLDKIWVNY